MNTPTRYRDDFLSMDPACWSWEPRLPDYAETLREVGFSGEMLAALMDISDADKEEARLLSWHAGRCAICGAHESTRARLLVDHNHATGLVRGLLCRSCNTLEGLRNDESTTIFHRYRERPPATILDIQRVYRDPLTGRPAQPAPPQPEDAFGSHNPLHGLL